MAERNLTHRSGIVELAARALLHLADGEGDVGVRELARALEASPSSVGRALVSLEKFGFVGYDGEVERYRLGSAVLRLSSAYSRRSSLVSVARPILQKLAGDTGETVCLSMLRGRESVIIAQVESAHNLRMTVDIGRMAPLHASASSRAMLACLPSDQIDTILAGPLEAITPNTPIDPAQVRADLAEIDRRGYAISRGELEIGAAAVAIAVRGRQGQPLAAIGVFGPEARLSQAMIEQVGRRLNEAATALGRVLGTEEPCG